MDRSRSKNRLRNSIRYEAARIIVDDGVRDYRRAKEKACQRLGVKTGLNVPKNMEIEDSVKDQLEIFSRDSLKRVQLQYLEAAYDIMKMLQGYSPKLTGAALSGIITSASSVQIQVFSNTVEEIGALLELREIPHKLIEKRLRYARRVYSNVPGFEFAWYDIEIEILVFLPGDPYPPFSRITAKPEKGGSLKKVRRMIKEITKEGLN